MQSHTCMAIGPLSFWCDSVPLEVVGSRTLSCLVHWRALPSLVILGYYKTNIKILCVCSLSLSPPIYIFVFCTLSAALRLCIRIGVPQFLIKLLNQRKRKPQKTLHNSTSPFLCVFLTFKDLRSAWLLEIRRLWKMQF